MSRRLRQLCARHVFFRAGCFVNIAAPLVGNSCGKCSLGRSRSHRPAESIGSRRSLVRRGEWNTFSGTGTGIRTPVPWLRNAAGDVGGLRLRLFSSEIRTDAWAVSGREGPCFVRNVSSFFQVVNRPAGGVASRAVAHPPPRLGQRRGRRRSPLRGPFRPGDVRGGRESCASSRPLGCYAAKWMISNSTDMLTPASSFSTFVKTGSAIRYSLHVPHCETGRLLRITIVCWLTLNGRSVVVV